MERPPVVAFVSTGRCGTQWLAAGLRDLYPDISVEHEPIGPLYKPRRYLRHEDPEALLSDPDIRAHMQRIAAQTGPYVETGWPLFVALPLMARRFAGRLRVVHLTRHPVPTALSHLAHSSYAGSARNDAYTRWATLGPEDPGVIQPHYRLAWERLSAYEKCLFWWTEVHAFALELPQRLSGVPLLRVDCESMLGGDEACLRRLIAFMALAWHDDWPARAGQVVDSWRHHTDAQVDPLAVLKHPLTCSVARRLGYDPGRVDVGALMARYRGRPNEGRDRVGRYVQQREPDPAA